MKMYVEVDNRLIKDDNNQNKKIIKETKVTTDQPTTENILESYGLSKNARVLTE